MSKKNMIGKKFGNLLVIDRDFKKKDKRWWWNCKCDCGNQKSVSGKLLRNGQTKTCGCRVKKHGKENQNWDGFEDLSGRYWSRIKKHAKNRNIEIKISIKEAWEQYIKQNKKCALTGLDLILEGGKPVKSKDWNGSLDRINNKKGYEISNIQWVHKDINIMKKNHDQFYFYEICKMIYLHLKGKYESN